MNAIEHWNKSISILAKRNMGDDQQRRFEACVYEDIWTRLTTSVSRVYENLFIFRQNHFRNHFHAQDLDLIYLWK